MEEVAEDQIVSMAFKAERAAEDRIIPEDPAYIAYEEQNKAQKNKDLDAFALTIQRIKYNILKER